MLFLDYEGQTDLGLVWSGRGDHQILWEVGYRLLPLVRNAELQQVLHCSATVRHLPNKQCLDPPFLHPLHPISRSMCSWCCWNKNASLLFVWRYSEHCFTDGIHRLA